MLQIAQLKQDPERVIQRLEHKQLKSAREIVTQVLALDEQWRQVLVKLETDRAEMNQAAKQIGQAMAQGRKDEAETLKARTGELKAAIQQNEEQIRQLEAELQAELVKLPNLPHESVPAGKGADDNLTVFSSTLPPEQVTPPAGALPHWELARKLDIIDWELGVKLTGAGFPVYKGQGARLLRGLIAFFLDRAHQAGYTEIVPPLMVNEASAFATGQLPDKEGQMYFVTEDQLYLIPTAEVPVTNLYRDEILDENQLPILNAGYTQCFRREAGSYGKDVRGLNRLHQFDKVEIVRVVKPEDSYAALEDMRQYVEGLATALELPWRTLLLCGGDMTFSSAKTYDLEIWSAVQQRWLESSSISNFEAYQANRLKLRYRPEGQKGTILCHTLNASALALPRIMAGILENHQTEDGRVKLPAALVPYVGTAFLG